MDNFIAKRILCSFLTFIYLIPTIEAQIYTDHFGAGHQVGVKVSSSAAQDQNEGQNTLSGTGYFPDLIGASRFLGQASMGANYEEIEYVSQVGIESWIDEQLDRSYVSYAAKFAELVADITELIQEVHPDYTYTESTLHNSMVFYESLLQDPNVLRDKVAFSLLQLFVISKFDTRPKESSALVSYHDVLYQGAYGNYKDLLVNVSLHPMMGLMLSSFGNKKADPNRGTLPDENYAREIMQLFTIGLFELNIDGTFKLDAQGNKIPTYGISDVQELARVFTGLTFAAYPDNYTAPMVMNQNSHDEGEKKLLEGTVLPPGQPGLQDIEDAIDVLFNHPNVGPFVARRLIQQLIKSNPTPAFIKRIATVFNNNGEDIRGDMGAVVKAILLDPEARNCNWIEEVKNGKLKQPIERFIGLWRGFDVESPSERLWLFDEFLFRETVEQAYMTAPSVFNYFSPLYSEDDYVKPNDMVSPAFQILHDVSAVHYFNILEASLKERPFHNSTKVQPNIEKISINLADEPILDFSDEIRILQTDGIPPLLDRLDLILCHGQLTAPSSAIIQNALEELQQINLSAEELVKNAIYFIMISPDYMIME